MKQVWLVAEKTLAPRDVEAPAPGPGQVKVALRACGVCGSDLHMYLGTHPIYKPPRLLGHEASGVVAALGEGVEGLSVGDEVTIFPQMGCGKCFHCLAGRQNLCPEGFLGCDMPGAFTEEIVVPAHIVRRLPEGMDLLAGAMVEPATVAVHAVRRPPAGLQGRSVAVYGAGPIGLLVAQAARVYGAGPVYVVDVLPDRLELAAQLGAAPINGGSEDPVEGLRRRVHGGVDVVFECSGNAKALLQGIESSREGGDVVLVGIVDGEVPITMVRIQRTERSLIGCQRYLMDDFEEAVRLVGSGDIQVAPLISRTVPFLDAQQAFEDVLARRAGIKTVLTMG